MAQNNLDLTGRIIATYTLEKLIGQGGMSTVYLARQSRPERHVAIKILRPLLHLDETNRQSFVLRFQHEANIIACLEHVNIIQIYEYGEQEQLDYLVMPYVAGGNLGQLLRARGRLNLYETLWYLQQAAAALDYAHSRAVVHRDLKPSNLLLYPDGRLVLADFGIAHMASSPINGRGLTLTPSGIVLGTPAYMAPEMVRGEEAEPRTDIYALGIILFHMLSGEVPYKGNSDYMVLSQHVQDPLPQIQALIAEIPASIDTILRKATAKEPAQRYTSAGALAQDFYTALNSLDHATIMASFNTPTRLLPPTPSGSFSPLPAQEPFPNSSASIPPEVTQRRARPAVLANEVSTPRIHQSTTAKTTAGKSGTQPHLLMALSGSTLLKTLPILALLLGLLYLGSKTVGAFAGFSAQTRTTITTTPHTTNQPTATPTPDPTPTPPPDPTPLPTSTPTSVSIVIPPVSQPSSQQTSTEAAKLMVLQFYASINARDYQSAYNNLTVEFQTNLSYQDFSNGYSNTIHDTVTFTHITPNTDGSITLETILQAQEKQNGANITNTYQWSCVAVQRNATWQILSAKAQKM